MSFGVQEKNTIHFQFHLIGYKDIAIGPQNAIQFISDNYLTTNNLSWKKYLRISVPLIALILSLRSLMNLNLFLPCLESHQKKKNVEVMYRCQHVLYLIQNHTHGQELKRLGATTFITQIYMPPIYLERTITSLFGGLLGAERISSRQEHQKDGNTTDYQKKSILKVLYFYRLWNLSSERQD